MMPDPDPMRVASTMRAVLREQCTMSYMDRDSLSYIFDNGLIAHVQWPAWLMKLTEQGQAYLQEHEAREEEAEHG